MAISFAVAMSVAFIIKKTTDIIENMNTAISKPDEVKRARRISKLSKKEILRLGKAYEKKSRIEVINHYYGDNRLDSADSQKELLNHYYPQN